MWDNHICCEFMNKDSLYYLEWTILWQISWSPGSSYYSLSLRCRTCTVVVPNWLCTPQSLILWIFPSCRSVLLPTCYRKKLLWWGLRVTWHLHENLNHCSQHSWHKQITGLMMHFGLVSKKSYHEYWPDVLWQNIPDMSVFAGVELLTSWPHQPEILENLEKQGTSYPREPTPSDILPSTGSYILTFPFHLKLEPSVRYQEFRLLVCGNNLYSTRKLDLCLERFSSDAMHKHCNWVLCLIALWA